MNLILNILVLLFSFYILAVVCERYFVNSLDLIAQKWNFNSDMAGATLMAIGSSAPELFVALFALFKPGNESIGAGTIVGSALFNILVIVGAAAIIKKARIAWQPVVRDLIFYAASIILLIISFKDGIITFWEILIFLILYVIYVFTVIRLKKILPYKEEKKETIEEFEEGFEEEERKKNFLSILLSFIDKVLDNLFPDEKYYWINFLMSILVIMGLSWVLVESAVNVSTILGIPSVVIGLTILAIGTSVPDLISSVIVARQGRGGMAISNALGSNIFNILVGLGLPWFAVIVFSNKTINVATGDLNSSVILLLATIIAILFLFIFKKWKIGRVIGIILITTYLIYLTWSVLQVI